MAFCSTVQRLRYRLAVAVDRSLHAPTNLQRSGAAVPCALRPHGCLATASHDLEILYTLYLVLGALDVTSAKVPAFEETGDVLDGLL